MFKDKLVASKKVPRTNNRLLFEVPPLSRGGGTCVRFQAFVGDGNAKFRKENATQLLPKKNYAKKGKEQL